MKKQQWVCSVVDGILAIGGVSATGMSRLGAWHEAAQSAYCASSSRTDGDQPRATRGVGTSALGASLEGGITPLGVVREGSFTMLHRCVTLYRDAALASRVPHTSLIDKQKHSTEWLWRACRVFRENCRFYQHRLCWRKVCAVRCCLQPLESNADQRRSYESYGSYGSYEKDNTRESTFLQVAIFVCLPLPVARVTPLGEMGAFSLSFAAYRSRPPTLFPCGCCLLQQYLNPSLTDSLRIAINNHTDTLQSKNIVFDIDISIAIHRTNHTTPDPNLPAHPRLLHERRGHAIKRKSLRATPPKL